MRKIYIIVLILLIMSGAGIILYSSLKSEDDFSENLINSLSADLENKLADYFNPIRDEFNRISVKQDTWDKRIPDEDSLSAVLISSISNNPSIGSVMIHRVNGYSYTIYREKNTFVSSLFTIPEEQESLQWSRRMKDNSVNSTWTEVLTGNELRRQVIREIIERIEGEDETLYWLPIYRSGLLEEPVITAAVDWKSPLDSTVFVCAMELPVRLIIRNLQGFNKYRDRRIFLAMESGELIDIPASAPNPVQSLHEQFNNGNMHIIKDSIIVEFLGSWKMNGGETDMTFNQHLNRNHWWIHIRDFPAISKISAIGLALPESSLKLGVLQTHSRLLIIILFLLISITLYLIASNRRNKSSSVSKQRR